MNNIRAKKILFRAADIVKVTVIYLLTFSMLLFTGIYINMRQNSAIKTNMPTEKLRSLEHLKYGLSAQNEIFCLLPVEYVISDKGNAKCCFNNNEVMLTLTERNKNILVSLFKSNAAYEKITSGEGEKLWEEAFGHEYFIYIKFANEFPAKILYDAFTEHFKLNSGDGANENAEDTPSVNAAGDSYIYELIIIPQKDGEENSGADNYYALSRDKNGVVTLIFPHEEASKLYNSKDIIAYNIIEGLVSCEFLKNNEELSSYAASLGIKLPGEAIIYKEDTFADVLNTDPAIHFNDDGSIDTTQDYVWNLFDILDFNLEKTTAYQTPYASEHIYNGTLTFQKDGLISYSAQSEPEGVRLEKLLGSRSNAIARGGNYTSGDKLAAAFNFVNIFREHYAGGAVSLLLTDVSFEEESGAIVYTFSRYINNIPIYGKDKTTAALTIKIKNDMITEIKFHSMLFFSAEKNIKNINQRLMFRQILDGYTPEQNIIDSFTLSYFYAGQGEKIYSKWAAVWEK